MIIHDTIAALREHLGRSRADGRRIALVPTMGALHDGHLHLCDIARDHADEVVMSIFVNPMQFGAGEDFERYPRALERDAALAAGRGVSIIFAPDVAGMYPAGAGGAAAAGGASAVSADGAASAVRVHAPGLDDRLCGRFRPGHFEGVLTVVAKLFNIVRPDVAVFGRKDLQQVVLVRRMVADLDFGIDVIAAEIVREHDGLAMSSRNAYLSPGERTSALALHAALEAGQRAFSAGATDPAALTAAASAILAAEPGVSPQYVELVDTQTLDTPAVAAPGHALAIAAHAGATRLIDNHILE